jgi:hypothetical protein
VQYTYSKKDSQMPVNISAVLDRYKRVSLWGMMIYVQ